MGCCCYRHWNSPRPLHCFSFPPPSHTLLIFQVHQNLLLGIHPSLALAAPHLHTHTTQPLLSFHCQRTALNGIRKKADFGKDTSYFFASPEAPTFLPKTAIRAGSYQGQAGSRVHAALLAAAPKHGAGKRRARAEDAGMGRRRRNILCSY